MSFKKEYENYLKNETKTTITVYNRYMPSELLLEFIRVLHKYNYDTYKTAEALGVDHYSVYSNAMKYKLFPPWK